MSVLSFFRSYGKVKSKSLMTDITSGIISLDLSGAQAAQLDMYDTRLAEISRKTVEAQTSFQREQNEADQARLNYNNHLRAVSDIQGQIATAQDDATKAELQASLATLVAEAERLKGVAEKEIQEAEEAKQVFDSYNEARNTLGQKLRDARQALQSSAARIAKARVDEERSRDLLAAEQTKAGLNNDGGGIDTVLTQMEKIANSAEQQAAANRAHAEALKPVEAPKDPNIEKALARVTGQSVSSGSLNDRISVLKPL